MAEDFRSGQAISRGLELNVLLRCAQQLRSFFMAFFEEVARVTSIIVTFL